MDRKIFIIWNPVSGGKSASILQKLTAYLQAKEIDFDVEDTKKTKNATISIQKRLDATYTDLIIVGGDGTINEAVNGLAFDIPVSIIPAGTGDDFAKNISLGQTLSSRIETAVFGKIRRIDLGRCNDRLFVNGVGIGFDGQIVEDMAVKRVPVLSGHAAYYYHVLRILGGYKERQVKFSIDDHAMEKDLILMTVGNGTTFGGGFKLMPEAKIDDGLLEVCEVGKISGFRRFLNIHKLSGGTHGSLKEVNFYKARKVNVASNLKLFAHIDGERMGQPPFEIEILPDALQLRVV